MIRLWIGERIWDGGSSAKRSLVGCVRWNREREDRLDRPGISV